MGYKIEPRCMSCVYKEYPYVGHGITARYFVLDETTNEVLAGNNGRGYKSFNDAYVAYQWMIKGPAAARARKVEQEMMYEWSKKNKIIIDRVDTLAYNYSQEGKELTPRHIEMLFSTQKTECPITPEAFLEAYQNKFYKDLVLQRRAKRKKKEEVRAKWNLKKRADDFIDSHERLALLREQFDPQSAARVVDPIKKLIKNSLNDHEERPMDKDAKERLNYRYISTVGPVIHTGQSFRGHEWEVVEQDPNLSPIYDTFGQHGPESVERIMHRDIMDSPYDWRMRLVAQTMIDPISYQVVPVRSSRCNSAQEWNQMAAGAKKKKKRLATIEPISDLETVDDIYEFDDDVNIDRIVMRSTATEKAIKEITESESTRQTEKPVKKIETNPNEWVGVPEESVFKMAPKKPIDVSELEPKEAKASISMGGSKKKRQRPEGLPPKKEPPKPKTFKEKVQAKVTQIREDWTFDDESEEEYDMPTAQEVLDSITNPFKNFFSAVKNEAERQKQEEQKQRNEKQQAKEAKRQEKLAAKNISNQEENLDSTPTGDAMIDDISAAINAQIAETERQDAKNLEKALKEADESMSDEDLFAAIDRFSSDDEDGTLSSVLDYEF